jgi:protein SCO1/2
MRRRSLETFGRALLLASLKSFALSAAALACLCFGSETAAAQQPSTAATAAPAAEQTAQTAAQKYFTDVVLLNQDGEKMRLYSDLLKDKVVVIDFFFATCQGSCLPLNRNLQKLQAALGDHVGKDVHFISVSVDPTADTPARLKEYAKKLDAGRGWYFLTGDKANVDFALRKLGGYVDDKQDHTNVFIIGNERTGLWKKAFGLAKSDDLLKVVESVLNDSPNGGR